MSENGVLSPLLLSAAQVEALRQLAGLASTDAARSLGKLLGTSVDADVPKAQVAPRGAVAKVLKPDGPSFTVPIYLGFAGPDTRRGACRVGRAAGHG